MNYNSEINKMTDQRQNFQAVYQQIDTSSKIVSVCSYCNSQKNDNGLWVMAPSLQQESLTYDRGHTAEVLFSHGICPSCAQKHFPIEYQRAISKNI
jgi:hypothetical protein